MLDGRVKEHIGVFLAIIDPSDDSNIANFGDYVSKIHWNSFINGGYTVSFTLTDVNHVSMNRLLQIGLLKYAREDKFYVRFAIGWNDETRTTKDKSLCWTNERIGIITRVDSPHIDRHKNQILIEVIDPTSWHLNRGLSSGKSYRGRIGGKFGVISQVIKEYSTGISVEVGDTIDNDQNVWHMMRMDPKSFIVSLMEWSASLTTDHTPWLVRSQDNSIIIKEMAQTRPPLDHNGKVFLNRVIDINMADQSQSEMLPNGMEQINKISVLHLVFTSIN